MPSGRYRSGRLKSDTPLSLRQASSRSRPGDPVRVVALPEPVRLPRGLAALGAHRLQPVGDRIEPLLYDPWIRDAVSHIMELPDAEHRQCRCCGVRGRN